MNHSSTIFHPGASRPALKSGAAVAATQASTAFAATQAGAAFAVSQAGVSASATSPVGAPSPAPAASSIPLSARRKVLVRGVNWVGDAVMTTPALRRLRRIFPDSEITLLVRPWVAAVYERNPDIDRLWIADDSASQSEFIRIVRRIRAENFNLAISFPGSFRSALMLRLAGIPRRIGYARGRRSLLLTKKIGLPSDLNERHEVFYYLNLVDWLSDAPPEPPQLVLHPDPDEFLEVSRIFSSLGIKPRELLVGIAPGSINSRAKRWLPERFAEVADRLTRERGARVFLLGSPKEQDVIDHVKSLCTQPVYTPPSGMSLTHVIDFLAWCHLFIGNDAGAMHLAAALNIPSVAIFGPTRWKTTAPFSPNSKIVRHAVKCSPCMKRDCPVPGHPCMTDLMVGDVWQVIEQLTPEIERRRNEHPSEFIPSLKERSAHAPEILDLRTRRTKPDPAPGSASPAAGE